MTSGTVNPERNVTGRGVTRAARVLPALASALLLAGCFDEPKIEDRWTRVDLQGANVRQGQALPLGTLQPISLQTTVTYRSIITGFAVADLRVSRTLGPASVAVNPAAPRVPMAQDIDRLLANSVSVGRATRAVTGWDHLIQHIDFSFNGAIPSVLDSAGTTGGLFLLCYLGSGDRVERPDGSDTLIVTPFPSAQYELLPIGMSFTPAP